VGTLILSFGAGALSTLSPCVLPLLPIILFGVLQQNVWGPLALAAGLSVSFAVLGIFIALIGFGIGLDPALVRAGAATVMIGLGVVLLVPAMQARLAFAGAPLATGAQSLIDRLRPAGLSGQFVLGALLGAVWSPCSGPTLGAAVGLAAQSETALQAAAIMTVFGLGAAVPILALAYGSRQAILTRRDGLAKLAGIAKPVMGVTLLALGFLVLTGFDKRMETALTNAAPDWLVSLTTRL
jgi:cytochrome c-type biogenesis protein